MAKSEDRPHAGRESPVMLELLRLDTGSAVALVGRPNSCDDGAFPDHLPWSPPLGLISSIGGRAILSGRGFAYWSAGFTFWTGVAASIVGTGELLLVPGIRLREASWSHAVAAMTLVAITGANWGLRLYYPQVDPAARPCALWSRRGDGWLRRLARWQARVRSWKWVLWFRPGKLAGLRGIESVCRELVEIDVGFGRATR